MSTLEFPCTSCGQKLKLPVEYAGRTGTCNHCGKRITIDVPRSFDKERLTQAVRIVDHLAVAAHNARSLSELVSIVPDAFSAWPECSKGTKLVLFLVDGKTGGLRLAETRGHFSRDFLEQEAFVPLGRCLCGRAAQSGEVLVCQECFSDPRHENRWLGMETHGHYVIPLKHAGKVLGVLTLYTRAGIQPDEDRTSALNEMGQFLGRELNRLLSQDK